MKRPPAAPPAPDPAHRPPEGRLEAAIGRAVRAFRLRHDLTVAALAARAGLSVGMLSKIENGRTSPSLATIQRLADALGVPVSAFLRSYDEQRDAVYVPAGQGLAIERRGTRAGHQYQLLGHGIGKRVAVEPYLITLTEKSEVFPVFQHAGQEFIHMLAGEVVYRHGVKAWLLRPGDSLLFDADAPHGPEELRRLPIRFLSILVSEREER
ncbi:XRE family transcriptional regulator [Stella humosa]|uniref:XRE family transcriptional regulator n=1 Tax=Stella humosa TaxID=94 RepID=A0A3N1LI48_9PROT|nr:XRE family transcriptional regulator [Stella humosa]ROP90894.1 XRE family transcriptional regulator [Stella humosa]